MKQTIQKPILSAVHQLVALLLALLVVFPIIYAILISFMNPAQILTLPPSIIPKQWTLENYQAASSVKMLWRMMLNSLILALSVSILRIFFASISAYAFSFFDFPLKKFFFTLCLGSVLIPFDVVLISNYRTISKLGLLDTYLGMMSVLCISAMNIFMMRQAFLSSSKSLREAASIDGCGDFKFFVRILLPTSRTVLTTVFISSFISTWNTYLWPMLVVNNAEMQTVQAGVRIIQNMFRDSNGYGPMMAVSCIILAPTILAFLLFRKQIVSGIMEGAVKAE